MVNIPRNLDRLTPQMLMMLRSGMHSLMHMETIEFQTYRNQILNESLNSWHKNRWRPDEVWLMTCATRHAEND